MNGSSVAYFEYRATPMTAVAGSRSAKAPFLSSKVANIALAVWLAGVLILGRAFAEIGYEPFFVADMLAISGVALSIPRWWPYMSQPGLRSLCLAAALLASFNVQSVVRGVEAGYPSALKSACMGIYPLVAVAIGGLVAHDPDLVRSFANRFLPLVPLGFLVMAQAGGSYIAAASGMYLAFAAAWAAVPGTTRRGVIAVSTLIAAGYLAEVAAKRGPTLAIVVALCGARLAMRKDFRTQSPARQTRVAITWCVSVVLVCMALLVLVNSSSRSSPEDLPVVGPLTVRLVASTQEGTESGNNVALRLEMWRYALATAAREHPFIGLGAGRPIEAGLGPTVIAKRESGPHNSFVGYAFYSGFITAILVIFVFVIALRSCWMYRANPMCASLFGAILAVVATCLTNVALETPFIAGPAWAVVGAGLGAAAATQARSNRENEPTTRHLHG
jgi:hypothetical protein